MGRRWIEGRGDAYQLFDEPTVRWSTGTGVGDNVFGLKLVEKMSSWIRTSLRKILRTVITKEFVVKKDEHWHAEHCINEHTLEGM